jgi:hypothetical protein
VEFVSKQKSSMKSMQVPRGGMGMSTKGEHGRGVD